MKELVSAARIASDSAMQAVMNKDREGWLECFASDGLLRDPVGGSRLDPEDQGFRGHQALGRFWDEVVVPTREVRFEVREEHAAGNAIAKVATVHLRFANDISVSYDGVFVYHVDADGRITSLCGYFTPPAAFA